MLKAISLICSTVAQALLLVLLLAGAARAHSVEAARAAYAEGRFIHAAELAASLETSEGYALAARSLAIYSYYIARYDEKQALFDRAALLAREAIRLDPANPEAHLELAHVMGRQAQTLGVLKAVNEGYAEKVRAAIEEALRLDPEMVPAHLSLATWHAEAVNGGGFLASVLYGATKKGALEHYRKALELAPGEKVVLVEYALGLLLLDEDRNREQARDLLMRAIEMPPEDAHDRIIHRRAVMRLTALDGQQSRRRQPRTNRSVGLPYAAALAHGAAMV